MNKLTFFFAFLLLLPIAIDEAFAQVEKGKNFDKIQLDELTFQWASHADRIFDGGQWKNYVFAEDIQKIRFESEGISFDFFKDTCDFKLYNQGFIGASSPVIDSYSMVLKYDEIVKILPGCSVTSFTQDITGIHITSLRGDLQTVYDVHFSRGVEWTHTITNNEGKTVNATITETCLNCTPIRTFDNIIDFGIYQLDTKNEVHGTVRDNMTIGNDFVINYEKEITNKEKLVIDPTFTDTTTDSNRYMSPTGAYSDCSTTAFDITSTDVLVALGINTDGSARCHIGGAVFDTTTFPDNPGIRITNVTVEFDVTAVSTALNGEVLLFNDYPRTNAKIYDEWADFTGEPLASTTTTFTTTGDGKTIENTTNSVLDILETIAQDENEVFIIFGYDSRTRDGTLHTTQIRDNDAVLHIEYLIGTPPDAVDDLVPGNTTTTTTDLLWTEPNLRGGILSGYQINFTIPHGNPLTEIVANTETNITNFAVSGLAQNSNYSFRVSAITNVTNNATGNIANITTLSFGNFTVGAIDIVATNLDFRTWIFERTDTNTTAYTLTVTYPNSYNATCQFHFKFANTDQNFSNLATTAPTSNQLRATFDFNNTANEIIDVLCINESDATTPEGIFLLTQTIPNFLLLQQFEQLRDGTFGTAGMFGSIDMITLVGILVAMIGLNRVNESVGMFFLLAILGVMAFFQIIVWPTAVTGILAVITMLVITSTRKS